ncbi:MAG: truncated hemoglobin YjbI [Sulfurimonas sp.]|jgi:truncated hemoglobin YjbI|uniref:group III truncated hemoglobin n=1 Tax=Sulfurimonas sp. TaxID=2022749 RepID=UPI0039E6E1B5
MTLFYEKAIDDEVLGPFFIHELGDDITDEDWVAHIDLLADFWLAELLGKDTYVGNFIGAHIKLPHIKKEAFSNWIKLFSAAADKVYVPELSERFKKHGILLSKQFISNLNPPTLKSSAIFQIKGKE